MSFHRLVLLTALLLAPAAPAQDPKPPAQLDPTEGCTTKCHQQLAQGAHVHKPVVEGKCTGCHAQEQPTAHTFAPIDDVSESCRSCHKIGKTEHVHEPLESLDCTACHDAHRSATKALLRGPDEATLCYTCHEPVKAAVARKFAHGPAADGQCTGCHRGHGSDLPKLLAAEPVELCTKCHEDVAKAVDEAESVHAPMSLECTPCHEPHGSDVAHVLKAEQPQLCYGCHKPLAESIAAAKSPHGALSAEKRCLECHRAHESKHGKLLAAPVRDGCARCHDKPQARAGGGKPVAPIAAELAGHEVLHGPVKDGDCGACHDPHVSPHPNLLDKAFPARFYAPYAAASYELCFGCHEPQAFAAEKTTTATGFRDGDRNLHFLHVNQPEKGRSCRACHALHGGGPKLVARTVAFGEWQLPIRWQQQPQGGACAPGCHKPANYRREAPPAGPGSGEATKRN